MGQKFKATKNEAALVTHMFYYRLGLYSWKELKDRLGLVEVNEHG